MSYKIYTVNAAGLKYISEFIKENLQNGEILHDDPACLNAWASQAENSIGEVGRPMFEIRSIWSVSGRPECCYMNLNEHFDEEIIEEDDEEDADNLNEAQKIINEASSAEEARANIKKEIANRLFCCADSFSDEEIICGIGFYCTFDELTIETRTTDKKLEKNATEKEIVDVIEMLVSEAADKHTRYFERDILRRFS